MADATTPAEDAAHAAEAPDDAGTINADDAGENPSIATAEDLLTLPVDDADISEIDFTNGCQVKFSIEGEDGPRSISYRSPARLHPDFEQARKNLIPLVLELIEIPAKAHNPVEITGVAFKTNADEAPGAVIKAKRQFSQSMGKHPLNTPVKFFEDKHPKKQFDQGQWAKLIAIRAEARLFLAGKGAEPTLFDQQAVENAQVDDIAAKVFDGPSGDGADTPAPAAPKAKKGKTVGRVAETDDEFDDGGKALNALKEKAGA